jgi:hypothetical protein
MLVALTGTGTTQGGSGGQHKLSVTTAGRGHGTVTGQTIACPGSCSGSFADGTSVTLTATPAAGSEFTGWSGACSGTGTRTVTVSGDTSVTAAFEQTAGRAPACTLKPGRRLAQGKRGRPRIALIVKCDQAAQLTLTGRLRAVVVVKRHGRRHHRKTEFAILRQRFAIAAGASLPIKLKLPARAGQLLAAGARESAVLTLTAANAGASTTTTARIAVRAKRAKARG